MLTVPPVSSNSPHIHHLLTNVALSGFLSFVTDVVELYHSQHTETGKTLQKPPKRKKRVQGISTKQHMASGQFWSIIRLLLDFQKNQLLPSVPVFLQVLSVRLSMSVCYICVPGQGCCSHQ